MRWLLALALCACSSKTEQAKPPPKPPAIADAAIARDKRLAVRADKRTELVSIAFRLANAPEYRRANNAYALAADKAFGPFHGHPAIAATAALRKRGIGYSTAMELAVHLNDALELANPDLPAFAGVDLPSYVASLRDLAKVSHFDEFFAAHASDHDALVAKTLAMIGDDDVVGFYDDVFGARRNATYTVVPSPLIGTHDFGVRDGDALYQLLGDDGSLAILVHELGHSYINAIFDGALKNDGVYLAMKRAMDMQNYGAGNVVLNESGVRALTVLYMHERKGPVAGAAQARDELRFGFLWIHDLVEVFRKCKRDHRGDFAACMPAIATFFDEVATKYATRPSTPFMGPFNALFWSDTGFVPPASPALRAYFDKLPFPRPTGTTGNVIAYGSPATNEWVKKAADWGLWKITPQGIELGERKFTGEHLVLIACWFRRDDPAHGVGVYAAADEADLVGINSLGHGPKDWIVAKRTAKGFEVVETGDWSVENNAIVPFAK